MKIPLVKRDTGLFEVININPPEKHIFHQIGVDKLTNLPNIILRIFRSSFTTSEIRIRLGDILSTRKNEKLKPET